MSEKQLKREFRLFTIAEYEKEETYLARKHREGWKLVTAAMPGWYTFEECEPESSICRCLRTAAGNMWTK